MITVLYFGPIKMITSLARETIETVSNLTELKRLLTRKYPKLEQANFVFSVNHKISENGTLNDHDEVALLPPFSGG